MLNTNLLVTKLHRPSIPARWVRRPHLIQRLNEGLKLERQVTLVSAPAGFGKTTCISEWVSTLDDLPDTWLSLDPADDDPRRFFAYLLAALQKVDTSLGWEIEGVLRSGQLPPAEIISTTLINDILERNARFLLVLDDFQVIQDVFILQVMEKLVTNLPGPLHLILLTREDPPLPLARLRASNRLTEIRAGDLRFTGREVDRFLSDTMGLSLSRADLASLEDKTEGWIAGLQLAAIAMQSTLSTRKQADLSHFIAALSGSHRFILSYLTEQVLNRQPEETRQFLLQTSILDRLNSDLCNAITGRSDGRAMLERLFNANLFLISLDEEQQWYRYHHLFADLLRDLQTARHKEETAELHRRASRWYTRAGESSAFASESIQHALAAEDYAMAVSVLENHALEMIMQGYAKTVNGWVQAVPAEWGTQSPRTHLAFAWMHLLRGAYSQATPYLERLEGIIANSQMNEAEKRSCKAEWLVMQSLLLNMQKKWVESQALVEQALEIVPEADSRVRSLVYFGQACAYQGVDEYELVVDAYQKAIQHGRVSGNLIAQMLSTSGLAQLALERGQLHLASEIAAPVCTQIEKTGTLPPISTVVFGILGEVHYQWHRIEPARKHITSALQLSTLGGYNSGIAGCRVMLARLYQLEADLEAAAREIQKAVELIQVDTPGYVRQETVSQQVRVALARNHPAAAELALQREGFSFHDHFGYPELLPDQVIPHSIGLLYNSSLCLLLQQARTGNDSSRLTDGIELAGKLISGALKGKYIPVALEALLLRAQMHAALGDTPSSRADFLAALEMGEPEGFIGVFIDQGRPVAEALADLSGQNIHDNLPREYIERILAAFRQSLPAQPPGTAQGEPSAAGLLTGKEPTALAEPLTNRERDVLRLMAAGLKYKEIAAELFISLNTVRFHVKAIYGKLHVNNRTQAIQAARQYRIL